MKRLTEWWSTRREKAEQTKRLYPIRWHSSIGLLAHELKVVHESTPELLTPELLGSVSNARKDIQASALRFQSFVLLAIGFLLLALFEIELPISVAGVELVSGPGVSEVLILAVAASSVAVAGKTAALLALTTASKILVPLVYDRELVYLQNIIHHTNEPPALYLPKIEALSWIKVTLSAQVIALALLLLCIIGVIGATIGARTLIYLQIWQHPTLDEFWSRACVILASVMDFGWVAFVLLYVMPLPYRDFSYLSTIEGAERISSSLALRVGVDFQGPTALAKLVQDSHKRRR